ncbi:HAD family phosphatase [uncultured Roseibium sp.]|uniref:HAD family hydrolase n=1 Tax=uncultured Roseibium sp. TaxID=1936171 RepID=UPI00261632E4|nr:HAD family phosphatase [uncultured Roseibium sp.]
MTRKITGPSATSSIDGSLAHSREQTLETLLSAAHALIFDCDGTLLKTPDLYTVGWQYAFKKTGLDMDAGWYHERAGMSEHVLMDAFEAEKNMVLDRDRTVRDLRQYILENIHSVQEISKVASIARAKHRHMPMAVASGGSRQIVLASLEASGLLPLFDAIVTIDDVEHAKPAPDLFLEAASRLKTLPEACLVFEDSAQGLQAAANAGMTAIDVAVI